MTFDVADKNNKVHTRVFAPKYGYLEDPATGSGNSAIGYYLSKYGFWSGSPISIEQGTNIQIPNIIKLDTIKGSKIEKHVLSGEKATVRIEGNYFLH